MDESRPNNFAAMALPFALAAGILACAALLGRDKRPPRTVSVSATSEAKVANEKAVVSLSVVTRGQSILEATEDNARKMALVQAALSEAGIADSDWATSNYTIRQEYAYQNQGGIRVYAPSSEYVVSNQINVTVADTSKAGDTIDKAIRAGANQLNSLSFKTGGTAEAKDKARVLALAEAERKAAMLAEKSGARLGRAIEIKESDENYIYATAQSNVLYDTAAEIPAPEPASIRAGTATVTVRIDAKYELR